MARLVRMWQTGELDGEQARDVADLDGEVAARLEMRWQIWASMLRRGWRRGGRPARL